MPLYTAKAVPLYFGAGDSGGATPAANSIFGFHAQFGLDPGGTTTGLWVPVSGTINYVKLQQLVFGTNGVNNENITYVLRKNDTTDSATIATLDTDAPDDKTAEVTSLGFAVSRGDFLCVKFTTPVSWTTQPTVMFWIAVAVIDVP